MAGSFDAKVEISTADAVNNLRNLKAEVKENAAQFRDFNKTLNESKTNIAEAAGKMTALAAARRQNAAAAKDEAANMVSAARATAIKTTADAKANQEAAKTAMFEARKNQAKAQGATADARTAAIQERAARTTANAADANRRMTESLSNTRYMMYDVGATLGILSGALMAVPAATAAVSMAYQRDFAQVLRVTEDLTNGGLELRNSIKDIARDIPVGFAELTRITQLGAQMGIANDQLSAFTETAAKFVAVTGIGADQSAQLFGRLESSFNPDRTIPDFFNKVGSAIAYVGAKTVATDPEIASMMNQIGSLGANAGMTAEQTIGLAAALASVRVQPELARGTLTRVFGQINRLAAEGAPELETYGKVIGNLSGEQAKALWESDPSEFFNRVIEGLHGLSSAEKTAAFDAMGIKASRDVSALTKLAVGYDTLALSMKAADKGFTEGTALDQMAKPVFDTVIAKLQKLANAWSNLADSVGGASLAPLAAVIDIVAGLANGLDDLIRQVPLVGGLIALLLGFAAVTAVFLGFKAAQAFVLAGLIGFQQMAGNRAVVSAMSLSGVLKELGRTFTLLSGQSNASSAALGRHSAAATAASGANAQLATSTVATAGAMGTGTSRVGKFASGLLAMTGGPIGIAIGALAVLAGGFLNASMEAQAAGKTIAEAMQAGAESGRYAVAKALNERKVQLSISEGDISFERLNQSVTEVARSVGVSFEDIVDAVSGGTESAAKFQAKMDELKGKAGFDKGKVDAYGWLGRVAKEMAESEKSAAEGLKDVEAAAPKAGSAAADLPEDFETAKTAIEKMDDALKALNDTIFGTLNAETKLQGSMAKIGEGLGKSGAFDTRSEGGRTNIENLEEGLQSARDYYKNLMDKDMATAQQAAQGYAQFVDALIAKIRATGGDPTPIVAMANQTKAVFEAAIGGRPVTIPVKTDPTQVTAVARDTRTAAQILLDQVAPTLKVGADSSEAKTEVLRLASYLATITGWDYNVVVNALTDPASEKGKQLQKLIVSITDDTYTADVNADTTAAIANVKNFSTYAKQELAQLQKEYDYAFRTGGDNQAGGFFKGSSNLALGRDWYGNGPTSTRPGMVSTTVAAPKQVKTKQEADLAMPGLNLDAVADGYKKVQDAAEKARKKNEEVWQDMGDGIDEATSKINDYANRLKTGLMSAFDKQYGMVSATDAYHSALNAITKKHEEELQQLSDMKEKVKELNNERNKDLIDANKAKIEQRISLKYGETDRAMDYGNQAQTALDAAAAKQKDIDATNKQSRELADGIGKLTGFSQAAIDNRAALRDLETKMIDMVVAYANTGASVDQVRAKAAQLTAQFQTDVGQMGLNMGAVAGMQGSMERYIGVVNRVPFLKPTKVEADTEEATGKLEALGALFDGLTTPRHGSITVDVKTGTVEKIPGYFLGADEKNGGQQVYRVSVDGKDTGQRLYNRGGQVRAFASGGLVPGRPPQNPRADNMMAQVDGKGLIKVRSREFIQPEEAVDYYGPDFMEAIRTLSLPKFNLGGSPSGASGTGYGMPSIVGLDAETLSFLASLKQEIRLYADSRELATSVNDGNRQLAAEGRNR